jgi:hypothetical protein
MDPLFNISEGIEGQVRAELSCAVQDKSCCVLGLSSSGLLEGGGCSVRLLNSRLHVPRLSCMLRCVVVQIEQLAWDSNSNLLAAAAGNEIVVW